MGLEINHKKRILFIITQSEAGGAQRFLYNLLNRINDRYEILVAFGFPENSDSKSKDELKEKLSNLGIEAHRLHHLKRSINPIDDIKAISEIRKLIAKFDPDDLFLLSSKAGFIGSIATVFPSKIKYLKVIYRIGGWSFNDPGPGWEKKLWLGLEKLSAKWKDVIIVNSRHDLEQAQKLKIKPREELILIHNGLDPYKLDFMSKDEARVKLFEKIARNSGRIFQANIIIGTIANLYLTKGIKFLIESAEYLKNNENAVFVVIGDGPERKNLESLISTHKLQNKIFLLGQISDAQRFIPAFDIFVLPSVKEGFPWALIEAMAAKIPVIATRVGAVPEIIDNGKNGFIVESANPAALAGKIKEILANDHIMKEFSIQSHQTVLFNFSEDKMIREIESLL